jgi:microsomal dipeptidase-like Zn-dependent dipeptidase
MSHRLPLFEAGLGPKIRDAATYQKLVAALEPAGYGEEGLAKIAGKNWLRWIRLGAKAPGERHNQ